MVNLETNRQFMKGAWGGLIAGVIMYVFVEFFRWIGLTKFGVSYLAGDTVFTYKNNLEMGIISFVIHEGISCFWGVLIAFVFTWVFTGEDYLPKTIFICFSIAFFHLGVMDEPFHYKRQIHKETLDLLIILAGYQLYGLVLANALKRMKLFIS